MFPLPLTCFEEYMLCDDRPAYPMTGAFRMKLRGFLDKSAFDKAVTTTVRRHPLLGATVCKGLFGRLRWIPHPDWLPAIQWNTLSNPSGYPQMTHFDLSREPGTRIFVTNRDNGNEVFLQIHHACSDAIGGSLVMEDLLTNYALNTGTHTDIPIRTGLDGIRNYLARSPAILSGSRLPVDDHVPPPSFPNPITREFDTGETQRIITASKSMGITVNDLLTRDLFLALGAWCEKNGIGREDDWLRLFIPMNLRSPADGNMPMANSMSLVFIDRRRNDLADPSILLKSIHNEMQFIKDNQLKYTFILSLGLLRIIPGALRRATSSDKCIASCCFSNIGPALNNVPLPGKDGYIQAGNVVLESVDFVIPLRPNMNAAFVAHTYGNRLNIMMHFDPRAIARDQAGDLMNTYIMQIRQTIKHL
jgi:hypothetical protein